MADAAGGSKENLITVRTYHYRHEAQAAQRLLENEKIESVIIADDCGGWYQGTVPVSLLVRGPDAETAQTLLSALGA